MHSTQPTTIAAGIDPAAVRALAGRLAGELIQPGDAQYNAARAVWNGMIDRHPALIARCSRVEDVVAAVNFARAHGLPLAVRGAGHNVAGHGTCDGGLVIDLGPMKQIQVDPVRRIAWAGGGVTWGELDAATQAYGLATPGGVFSGTGIAGLTLGGGFGWLRNKYGLSCDNLIGAEVVTAAGQVVHASARENPDLLWGLRGGGGNFGIVTTFEYQLHPVGPEVMFVFVFHDGAADNMARAIRLYRDYSAEAPDEVSTLMACGVIPPDPHVFPAELHGRPMVLFGGLYAGPVEEGRRALQPLLDFGAPLMDASGVMPYVDAQKMFDHDYPDGRRYYWKSLNLSRLDDAAIARIVAHARRQPSPFSTTDIWHIGGAVARVGAEESAFHGRQASFLLSPEANWDNPQDDAANIGWLRDFIADMEEFSDGSRYLNFPGFQEEGDAMMRAAFGPQYARLAALKARYDPHNLFRLNQNVRPG
ncbi:MAG TPA: FAD-binding oxidoreductase [Roseiflexaceae bacterium]|nr:FAD-binding oxidoreductase [Roseiflexaceae bacterium]